MTFAASEPMWVTGNIASVVNEERYDLTLFYSFNFTVWDSNGTLQIGKNIPTIVPTELLASKPEQGNSFNFSGRINDVQTGEIPVGVFVVEVVNGSIQQPDWMQLVKNAILVVSSVMGAIVRAIAQVIYFASGERVVVPEAIITVILAGLFLYILWKYHKIIGLIFVFVLIFLVVSGVFNIVRLAWI